MSKCPGKIIYKVKSMNSEWIFKQESQSVEITEPLMSIGTFAEKVGLSVSAVRKYEQEGLLIAHRSATGRRLYSTEDIERVTFIKHLINKVGLNIVGIRRLLAFLPCWEILPCSEAKREKCLARADAARPCWMVKNTMCGESSEECRLCPVYRFGTRCTQDMKRLVYLRTEGTEKNEALRILQQLYQQEDR